MMHMRLSPDEKLLGEMQAHVTFTVTEDAEGQPWVTWKVSGPFGIREIRTDDASLAVLGVKEELEDSLLKFTEALDD